MKNVLKQFLDMSVSNSNEVFDKFKTIPNHIYREGGKLKRFLYIEGTREDKVLLVAHADTVFDKNYTKRDAYHNVIEDNGFYKSVDEQGKPTLLGADDRAGCAILWLLKDSGHSILITDGEERGCISANWLIDENPDIATRINNHQFMIQFDRRNGTDYKCYDVGTDSFRKFLNENTTFREADRFSFTDICTLAKDICAVNFSVGYYDEHTSQERINISEWLYTLEMTKTLLEKELPKFKLTPNTQFVNELIIDELYDFVQSNPDIRFNQMLNIMDINTDFYEESIKTLEKIKQFNEKTYKKKR